MSRVRGHFNDFAGTVVADAARPEADFIPRVANQVVVVVTEVFSVVRPSVFLLPHNVGNEIAGAEHFVHQDSQMPRFLIVDADEDRTRVLSVC